MWTTVVTFGLNKLFGAGDKALDVRHIHKAINRLRAEVDEATRDQHITNAEWCKILAHFIGLIAIAFQGAKD